MTSSTTAPARRNQQLEGLLDRVDQARNRLAAYLPPDVDVDRFIALARRSIAENPDIAKCSTGSVLQALSRCASSGLPLDGQFSSLIVRKSKNGPPTANWDPSYRGMTTMALSSGFVTDVQSFVVKELDEFSVEQGTEPKIRHVPALLRGGRVVAAYAWARMRGGQLVIEILGADDIGRIKAMSPAGDRGPWGAWEDQMARKSAVRRLLKKLPAAPARFVSLPDAVSRETPLSEPHPLPGPSREQPLPEDEHAIECRALERIRDAAGDAELNAAWQQSQVEFQQAGLEVTAAVKSSYAARLNEGAAANGGEINDDTAQWLRDYENAP